MLLKPCGVWHVLRFFFLFICKAEPYQAKMKSWWSCRPSCVQFTVLYYTVTLTWRPGDHANDSVSDALYCTVVRDLRGALEIMPIILCPMYCTVLYCTVGLTCRSGDHANHPVSNVLYCTLLWDLHGDLVIMHSILCHMYSPILNCGTYVKLCWLCLASCVQFNSISMYYPVLCWSCPAFCV